MPSTRQSIPASWTQHARDGRRDSHDSTLSASRVHFPIDEEDATEHHESGFAQQVRHRRSSVSMRITSIRHAGGVNSIDNFARSFTRAAAFHEIAPAFRPSFRFTEVDEVDGDAQRQSDLESSSPHEQRSLLRHNLTYGERRPSDNVIDDSEHGPKDTNHISEEGTVRARPRRESAFHVEPQLQSVFGGSYGTTYGSFAAHMPASSLRRTTLIARPQIIADAPVSEDGEAEPLLVKQVEEPDGKIVSVVVGQSTLPQTIFNSVNVLIGIGILALPLALQYSGWVIGLLFLVWAAIVTSYTAALLAKCLDVDSSLITFADLALVSYGPRARLLTSLLFSVELLGACVALVVLFADSLNALVPGLSTLYWKLICGVLLVPLSFVPLSALSFTSILGILSCTLIVLSVLIGGLVKPDAPGSLRDPMPTYLFPENWATVPISLGLLMSPWGGHSVFPNIYRDMRHPYKYRRAVNYTYAITSALDMFMAVIGLLMFGDGVRDEVTSNILITNGYPEWLSGVICACIAVIPLTKIPLNARPIVATIEVLCGVIDPNQPHQAPTFRKRLAAVFVRLITTALFVIFAILLPSFDTIMSLLGSVACFSICIILPLLFHLRLFGKEISTLERWSNWALIFVSTIMAIVSTVFNCIPKEKLGIK